MCYCVGNACQLMACIDCKIVHRHTSTTDTLRFFQMWVDCTKTLTMFYNKALKFVFAIHSYECRASYPNCYLTIFHITIFIRVQFDLTSLSHPWVFWFRINIYLAINIYLNIKTIYNIFRDAITNFTVCMDHLNYLK